MMANTTKKVLRRPSTAPQRIGGRKGSVAAETVPKQTKSKPASSSQSTKKEPKNQLEQQGPRGSKRGAATGHEDGVQNKRRRTTAREANAPPVSQDSLVQGGLTKNEAAPDLTPGGEQTENNGEAEYEPEDEGEDEDDGHESVGGSTEVIGTPQSKNQRIIRVKSKTAKKGAGVSRKTKIEGKPRDQSSIVNPNSDFDEDDVDDYDGPLPEDQSAELPGLLPESGTTISAQLEYNKMESLLPVSSETVPQCVNAIEKFWVTMNEEDLLKLRTNLAPKLDLSKTWHSALDIIEDVPTASRTELIIELEKLRKKLKNLTQRYRWRRKDDIVHDYYIVVHPSLVMLVILSIAALSPLYKNKASALAETCKVIDTIYSFILEVKDLEIHMTNQKLTTISYAFRRDIKKVTQSTLKTLAEAFHLELRRRKEALGNIDAKRKMQREAQREHAEIAAEREAFRTRNELELEKQWARQAARQARAYEKAQRLSREQLQENKEARIWKYRDIIWFRLTQIMEPMFPYLSADERVQACVGDPLLVDFGMTKDDIQRTAMDMVLWKKDECRAREGWKIEKWAWVCTLLDEWDMLGDEAV